MKGLTVVLAMLLPFTIALSLQDYSLTPDSYRRMARQIAQSLRPAAGEYAILRYDAETLPALEPLVRKLLQDAGAVVETIPYGPAPGFEQKLNRADIYVWLPAGPRAVTPLDQTNLLGKWLDSGKGRQVHFHWGDGTRGADGINGVHSAAYDRVYMDALDIDYQALDKQMDLVISKLRSGEVRVTTPAGTDIRFRVGDRPFCKQNGDASKARMAGARVRIDREIELPAGALRVAPLEDSVVGRMVIPAARIENLEVKDIRLEIDKGQLISATSATNQDSLRRYLTPGSRMTPFREFALGMNPKLVVPQGERWVPYYGYGAGVVRLGLGDNSELGGAARGLPIRWLFFQDATVRVGTDILVDRGRLIVSR